MLLRVLRLVSARPVSRQHSGGQRDKENQTDLESTILARGIAGHDFTWPFERILGISPLIAKESFAAAPLPNGTNPVLRLFALGMVSPLTGRGCEKRSEEHTSELQSLTNLV